MKYRQEPVAEKEWDGEFEMYDEWARFGPQPPYRSAIFLDAQGRRCITQQDFARAWEGGAFPVRYYWKTPEARKTQIGYDTRRLLKSCPPNTSRQT
jgi:hypothetical protein